jgi:hypothetical protein
MSVRMRGLERRSQVLGIAASEFANHGLHGASIEMQGFAACGDTEVRDLVRGRLGQMWDAVAGTSGLDPVTVKSFLAFGMLLNTLAAVDVDELDEPWVRGVRTRIHAGPFEHITTATNR